MAQGGKKYPLVIYQHLVNRWWTPMFAIGFVMFALAYNEYIHPIHRYQPWRWQALGGIGALAILLGIFFLILRQIAYIQPMPGYLKFVTPFLRFNISYKRIHKTTTAEMQGLFPPKSMSGWLREIIKPLASQTVIVLELKAFPIPPFVLRMFLSRFFFKDKTPHIVILVKDWMHFSSELDSFSTGPARRQKTPKEEVYSSILSSLPKK